MAPFKLLFVDDEVDFLSTVKEYFEGMGYPVYIAGNGQEGLLRVKEQRPDVVFLDISMPHMDGAEALTLIHELDPRAQVVVVSGYATESLARELLDRGAYDFFQKPIDLVQLHQAVELLRLLRDLSHS